jgi:hypothetical protein
MKSEDYTLNVEIKPLMPNFQDQKFKRRKHMMFTYKILFS